MRVRFSLLACWLGLISGMGGLTSCDWKPVARPVEPELILEGAIRVEMLLDLQGRYVLTSKERIDADDVPRRAYSIVDWKTAQHCDLSPEAVRFTSPLYGPSAKRKMSPLFLLPIARQDGEAQVLEFVDEHCKVRGKEDYSIVSNTWQAVTLDEDNREVLLYGNGKGVLAIADPWRDERSQIAEGVRRFAFVQRASAFSSPLLLWLVEDGILTQRALDGTLVLSLGEMVSEFSQVLFGELRVAYVDHGDMYEAVSPSFTPTRLAEAACQPIYRGNTLELLRPCLDKQLVRINLQSGDVTEFEKGVFDSYTDNLYHFELQRDEMGKIHQWVEPPGGERKEITPQFAGRPLLLGNSRLAGLKDLPKNPDEPDGPKSRNFVITDLNAGSDFSVLEDISDLFIFNDNRSSSYVWMVQHNLHVTEGEHRVGDLSLFGERSLAVETIRSNVPERSPLGGTPTGVHGYSVETAIPFREPLIIVISDAEPLSSNPKLSRGTLEARLLSGDLGSTIAHDVTSYFLVTTPLPGVLYGVEEGENLGLWFAAL
jgi:hypothetical protein